MKFTIAALAVSATLMSLSAPAMAVSQISTPVSIDASKLGTSFKVVYNGYSTELLKSYLKAESIFKLTSVSADKKTWTFGIVEYTNLTTLPATQARLAAFGFDTVGATISSATISGAGSIDKAILNGSFPQINQNLNVCFSPGNNCASAGNGGLNIGASLPAGGSFVLKFASAVQTIHLDHFTVRYNAIVGTGTEPSASGEAVAVTVTPFPEPGVWVEMIIGFGLVGAATRRKRGLPAHA